MITRKSAKAKGARLQSELRVKLLQEFPQLETDDVLSTSLGSNGVDIKLSPAAKRLIPFSFECKNQEKLSIFSALEQAETNAKPDTEPVLVFKRNRSKTYAVVEIDTFMKLIKK